MEFFSLLFLLFSVNGINYAASLFSCEKKALLLLLYFKRLLQRIILYVPSCHRAFCVAACVDRRAFQPFPLPPLTH